MAFITESVHCAVRTGSSDIDNFSGNSTVFRLFILVLLLHIWQQLLNATYCINALCVKTKTTTPSHYGSKICRGDGMYSTCLCWCLHNGSTNIIYCVYIRLFNLNISIYVFTCFYVYIMLTASVVQNYMRHWIGAFKMRFILPIKYTALNLCY